MSETVDRRLEVRTGKCMRTRRIRQHTHPTHAQNALVRRSPIVNMYIREALDRYGWRGACLAPNHSNDTNAHRISATSTHDITNIVGLPLHVGGKRINVFGKRVRITCGIHTHTCEQSTYAAVLPLACDPPKKNLKREKRFPCICGVARVCVCVHTT